ncbi:MAG: cell division FtsA domain-containing protein [Deltaproteobacteria bacterium]|nr:cell division FtsA domain-containing protein [Deltaproteobacteria bacterium]
MFKRTKKDAKGEIRQEDKIAVDIGFSSIKFAYFKNNLLCLDEFSLFDQPKDLRGMKDQELKGILTSVIAKGLMVINPKADLILSPQPSRQVLARVLQQTAEIDVRRYLEKELPFESDQFGFDHQRLGARPREKASKKEEKRPSRLAVIAADMDFIQGTIGLLGEHQLKIKKLVPHHIALMNYLLLTSNGEEDSPVVFLDLGALYSHLIVFKSRETFLARTIELGGNHFNQELVEKLNVDFDTAERIKTERKLIDDSLFDSKGASTSLPMYQAINAVLYGLVDEIKHSMTFFEDFFMEDLSGGSVRLAGGASNLQNLERFLQKELDLPVHRVESAIHNLSPDHPFSSQFASAVGLIGDSNRQDLLNLNLISNIEGMLFRLEDGDYYLTREGFVNKKRYKKKKPKTKEKPSVTGKKGPDMDVQAVSLFEFIKDLPSRILSFFRGEKPQMREIKVSFTEIDLTPIKGHAKNIFVVLGALFLLVYGGHRFFWAPKATALDRTISRYVSKTDELSSAKASLAAGTSDERNPALMISKTDKIIWAGTLKAIAESIPESVWVSDLVIQGTPPALVLSCHVYSFGEDHLKDIARFIRSIKSHSALSQDFGEVKFQSAVRNPKDKDIYDFTLTFPLKRDIIQQITEPVQTAKG